MEPTRRTVTVALIACLVAPSALADKPAQELTIEVSQAEAGHLVVRAYVINHDKGLQILDRGGIEVDIDGEKVPISIEMRQDQPMSRRIRFEWITLPPERRVLVNTAHYKPEKPLSKPVSVSARVQLRTQDGQTLALESAPVQFAPGHEGV